MMKTASTIVDELRVGVTMSDEQHTQIMYEQWLKNDRWDLRDSALPLVVGYEPSKWRAYIKENRLHAAEEILWHIVANDLGADEHASIDVSKIVEWARTQSIVLHPSFLRIYEFVRKVLLASAPQAPASSPVNERDESLTEEREVVLGAALSILSKMPHKCRDENGFVDGAAIVGLIKTTAARWFPASEPVMSEGEMVSLIDKWLQ